MTLWGVPEAQANVSFLRDQTNMAIGIVGTTRDIAERKRAEEEKDLIEYVVKEKNAFMRMLQEVTVAANTSDESEIAMRTVLNAVCAQTQWPVGHIYTSKPDAADILEPTTIWHFDDPKRFQTFRKVTEATSFKIGIGLPGRVLTGPPLWPSLMAASIVTASKLRWEWL